MLYASQPIQQIPHKQQKRDEMGKRAEAFVLHFTHIIISDDYDDHVPSVKIRPIPCPE